MGPSPASPWKSPEARHLPHHRAIIHLTSQKGTDFFSTEIFPWLSYDTSYPSHGADILGACPRSVSLRISKKLIWNRSLFIFLQDHSEGYLNHRHIPISNFTTMKLYISPISHTNSSCLPLNWVSFPCRNSIRFEI